MGLTTRRFHKKILKLAKGYRGRQKNCYTIAIRSVIKAQARSYVGRKLKKRNMRKLWIQRINATSRLFGTNYRSVIDKEKKSGILLNRKMLSELAVTEPCSFNSILCAFEVIEKMGIADPAAAANEAVAKLPDHAPADDIQAILDEMNRLSLLYVYSNKQLNKRLKQYFFYRIDRRSSRRKRYLSPISDLL